MNKVQNLVEMMDLIKMNDSGPNMAPIAETAKNELKKGVNGALETARMFNTMCLWSIAAVPHPDYEGNQSWFSLLRPVDGTLIIKKPWHQYIHIFEAETVYNVKSFLEAAIHIQQYGIEVNTKNLGELLKPVERQTLEGQRILFPALYQKDTENLEEGELENSPATSQADLDKLSGDWLKKVSWKAEGEKD